MCFKSNFSLFTFVVATNTYYLFYDLNKYDCSTLKQITILIQKAAKFRSYDFTEAYKANGMFINFCKYSLFRKFVFSFTRNCGKVFKIDLSFIDESKEPTLIPLPDITELKMTVCSLTSIQWPLHKALREIHSIFQRNVTDNSFETTCISNRMFHCSFM